MLEEYSIYSVYSTSKSGIAGRAGIAPIVDRFIWTLKAHLFRNRMISVPFELE